MVQNLVGLVLLPFNGVAALLSTHLAVRAAVRNQRALSMLLGSKDGVVDIFFDDEPELPEMRCVAPRPTLHVVGRA